MPNHCKSRYRTRVTNNRSQWRESLMSVMHSPTEKTTPAEINVGQRLRELRTTQGLSIRSLAAMSGLNFNTLSLIEHDKTSPNVNTLQQLATALRVSITAFFDQSMVQKEVVFQKTRQRPRTQFPHGELEDLGGGLALGEATPLLMTAKPNSTSGADGIVHSGQEFVYCLEGSITYWIGDKDYQLEQGDSLIFQAYIPHHWENKGQVISRSILVICPSDNSDRSVEQHLMNVEIEKET